MNSKKLGHALLSVIAKESEYAQFQVIALVHQATAKAEILASLASLIVPNAQICHHV